MLATELALEKAVEFAIRIVLAQVDDRKIPDRRQVETLVKRALRGGAVAEEAQRDPVQALHLGAERGSGRDRKPGSDDARLPQAADAEVRQVHGATFTLIHARRLAHQLSKQAIDPCPFADRMAV